MILLVAAIVSPAPGSAQMSSPHLVLESKIPLGEVSGRIDHLGIDLKRQRLFVAELGNDSVGVIDLAAGRLLRTIPGMSEPQGIDFPSKTYWCGAPAMTGPIAVEFGPLLPGVNGDSAPGRVGRILKSLGVVDRDCNAAAAVTRSHHADVFRDTSRVLGTGLFVRSRKFLRAKWGVAETVSARRRDLAGQRQAGLDIAPARPVNGHVVNAPAGVTFGSGCCSPGNGAPLASNVDGRVPA